MNPTIITDLSMDLTMPPGQICQNLTSFLLPVMGFPEANTMTIDGQDVVVLSLIVTIAGADVEVVNG
jgi:hypothetical protein